MTLINVNILEGIRFYVSFIVRLHLVNLNLWKVVFKIISLIARDENLHLAVSQNMINNYRNKENDKEMLKVIKENEEEVYKMYDDVVQQEKDWARYLFDKGTL